MSKQKTAISPTREENYPEWYQQVIKAADLAEQSPVRGCMVIKPWGYAIWENFRHVLDEKFKATGHRNAYFPLLIPLRYIQKEAEHVEGFASVVVAVVDVDRTDRFGGARAGRNHVQGRRAGPAQIGMRQIQRALVIGIAVHGRHRGFRDAESVVQNLRDRRQAVGRAGGV